MRRTAPGLLDDLEALIGAAERRHPQWHVLIGPLRETARTLDDPSWADAATLAELSPKRASDAPILDGAAIPAPPDALRRLLPAVSDPVSLVEASIRGENEDVRASLAAMPLLHACARAHADRIPPDWNHGYCPVCGARAILAELVGIDRARHLRCGRCAADWKFSWLRCPYCGEGDHTRLGRLVPEATRETRYLETCTSCGGYIKTVTTLTPSAAIELTLKDLDTVELDVVALEHGFTRPAGLGHSLDVRLASR